MAVCGQEVWAPVLALVADLQRSAVLGLARVVGAHQLKHQIFKSVPPFLLYKEVYSLQFNQEFLFRCTEERKH